VLQFAKSALAFAETETSSGSASPSETVSSVDYSDALAQISQLVAYTDLVLIVISVLMFLGVGLFFGHLVTRWMHGR